jgi:hypothetical protein
MGCAAHLDCSHLQSGVMLMDDNSVSLQDSVSWPETRGVHMKDGRFHKDTISSVLYVKNLRFRKQNKSHFADNFERTIVWIRYRAAKVLNIQN